MSTWSEINPFRKGRFYHLAIYGSGALLPGSEWEKMSGGVRLKPMSQRHFEASLQKAVSGGYKALVFAVNSVLHKDFLNYVAQTHSAGLTPILQLSSESFQRVWATYGEKLQESPLRFELILQSWPEDNTLLDLWKSQERLHITLAGFKNAPIWKQLERIPLKYYSLLHFYFPYQYQRKNIFAPWEIIGVERFFSQKQKNFVLRPPLGVDVYDPRITSHCDLESTVQPVFRAGWSEAPHVSVVIPSYNSGRQLMNTLSHLERQSLPQEQYEVVVVDDGSSDATSEWIQEKDFKLNLTYLYYPRLQKRQMGDSQFRAGLARNLGVKWARGEHLVFVDSDILVPRNFLKKTIELHKKWDVVQWRRDELGEKAPSPDMRYEDVVSQRDCYIPEGGYWHDFFQQAEQSAWSDIPDYWKYSCTYAFSLKRDLFNEVGRFRKTFCFYGLEDTDLGWRLFQAGKTFHLENTPVYHLYQKHERSEFQNSAALRQQLLKNTVRIFFNNNLSPEIYRVFKTYLRENWFF